MHAERRAAREMLAMVRATLQDGKVHEEEAESLRVWLKYHPDMVVTGLGKEIAEKLVAVFEDPRIAQRERKETLVLLQELVGQDPE